MKFEAKYFDELTCGELYEIMKARMEIFVVEQNIQYQDLDDIDYRSLHCYMTEGDRVVAYLRAFYAEEPETVKLGRVLTITHGKGHGRALMERSMEMLLQRMPHRVLALHAQKPVIGFYEKLGFCVTSDEFTEAGIIHAKMQKRVE